jgi:hypothetical protein
VAEAIAGAGGVGEGTGMFSAGVGAAGVEGDAALSFGVDFFDPSSVSMTYSPATLLLRLRGACGGLGGGLLLLR